MQWDVLQNPYRFRRWHNLTSSLDRKNDNFKVIIAIFRSNNLIIRKNTIVGAGRKRNNKEFVQIQKNINKIKNF